MRVTEMLDGSREKRPSASSKILGRIRTHLVGRVMTLASAIALHAILCVALLPLATRVLSAADYGTYALLMSIVALVGAAADGGAGLLLPVHYSPASASERGRLFVSLALFSGVGAIASGLFLVGLWIWQSSALSVPPISLAAVALSAALMPMRAITNISVSIFSVTGRGVAIAAQMAIQSIVVFFSTLVALFAFGMEMTSLFIGAACGQLAALCVGLLVLRRHRELSLPSRHWLRRVTTSAPTTGAAGFVDGAHGLGENAMLTSAGGLHALGILSHARVYYSLLMAFGSAVSHNVWAESLEDARNPHSNFRSSRRAWTPVQIAFASAGIVFALVGEEIVNIVSSGKFTEAAAYIPALFIIALIQTTEQPANAIVCASGRGASATWMRTTMALGGLIVLYPSTVVFGINGVVVICIIEAVAYRQFLRLLASRKREVPFQDHVAVLGSFAILVETAYVHLAVPPLTIQLALMVTGIVMLLVTGRRSMREMISTARQVLLGRPAINRDASNTTCR
jgi:O-antigen/teichoic acid export membrane protein